MKKILLIQAVLLLSILHTTSSAGSFDLTIDEIKDSSSLIEKIKQADNPLHPYYAKTPITRSDIVEVINVKVIPTTDFAYNTTQLAELKVNNSFESLSNDKKEETMAKNRDILTELFPMEIESRNTETIKQSFGLHIPIQKADSASWLKAEIVNFINEIMSNEKMLRNWEKLKPFFDNTISDKNIQAFAEELMTFNVKKIPVNAIDVRILKSDKKAEIIILGKNDRGKKTLFTVSMIPGKNWKILQVTNLSNDLFQTGYTVKKEVSK